MESWDKTETYLEQRIEKNRARAVNEACLALVRAERPQWHDALECHRVAGGGVLFRIRPQAPLAFWRRGLIAFNKTLTMYVRVKPRNGEVEISIDNAGVRRGAPFERQRCPVSEAKPTLDAFLAKLTAKR